METLNYNNLQALASDRLLSHIISVHNYRQRYILINKLIEATDNFKAKCVNSQPTRHINYSARARLIAKGIIRTPQTM